MTNDEKLAQILEESGRKDAPPGKPQHSRDWTAEAPAVEPNPIRDIGNRMREQRYERVESLPAARIGHGPTGRPKTSPSQMQYPPVTVLDFVPAAADIDGDKSLKQFDPDVQQARAFLNTPEARVLRALYLAGVLPADVYVKAIQIMRGMS